MATLTTSIQYSFGSFCHSNQSRKINKRNKKNYALNQNRSYQSVIQKLCDTGETRENNDFFELYTSLGMLDTFSHSGSMRYIHYEISIILLTLEI